MSHMNKYIAHSPPARVTCEVHLTLSSVYSSSLKYLSLHRSVFSGVYSSLQSTPLWLKFLCSASDWCAPCLKCPGSQLPLHSEMHFSRHPPSWNPPSWNHPSWNPPFWNPPSRNPSDFKPSVASAATFQASSWNLPPWSFLEAIESVAPTPLKVGH